MKISAVAAAVSAALTLGVAGVAVASDQMSKTEAAADKDLGKLSIDGAGAYQDIGLARLAIYDGKPDIAVKMVNDAMASLSRAKGDDTVFMKAEADMKPPKGAKADTQAEASPGTTAISWVPVDGEFMLDETLKPETAKSGAVDEANKRLHNGEPDKAKEALKVASVDADYVVALAPLQQTMQDVQKASALLSKNDYYGASQQLRAVQMGVRYDTVAFQDDPHAAAKKNGATAKD